MRVIVAGGGIGGLAAALALARRGVEVQVLERAQAFGEVGAGVQLAPNATRLLYAMGLEQALAPHAFRPQAVRIVDRRTQRALLETPLGVETEALWGAPYLQIHRADLHSTLRFAAESAGVRLHSGAVLTGFGTVSDGIAVACLGRPSRVADVLLGADGIRSAVRAQMFGDVPARFTGVMAWRGVVETDALPAGLPPPTATVWAGGGAHVVCYYVRGGQAVNFAGFTPSGRAGPESWTEAAAPGDLASVFDNWPAPVRAIAQALEKASKPAWRYAVHDRPPLARWTQGPVALLGDAAHPMVPYLAQGAGMAIEDAEAVARHLASGRPTAEALQAYASERMTRVARVQAWASRNGAVFHLPGPLRQAAFAAARATGQSGRLDWLYGYRPPVG